MFSVNFLIDLRNIKLFFAKYQKDSISFVITDTNMIDSKTEGKLCRVYEVFLRLKAILKYRS